MIFERSCADREAPEDRRRLLSRLGYSKIGPTGQPTPGRVTPFVILAIFGLLVVVPRFVDDMIIVNFIYCLRHNRNNTLVGYSLLWCVYQ